MSLAQFKELDHYLAAHLPRIHAGQHWQNIVYFFKEVERQRDQQRRLDDMERDVMETVRRALELCTVFFYVDIFYIVIQGCCESRENICISVQNQ